MKKRSTAFLTQSAAIAAIYVILTLFANLLGLANYSIQLRFSEALSILPIFTPAAIPGLFVGCLLSNIMTGCVVWDIVFGPIATLLGALGTYALRKKPKFWAILPPIIANTIIIPFILSYAYSFEGSLIYFMFTVGMGEIISCGVLGLILASGLHKYRNHIFE